MITTVLLASLAVYYLDFIMGEGFILNEYRNTIRKLPNWAAKPMGACRYCMSFWVGVMASLINGITDIPHVILVSLSVGGLSLLIFTLDENLIYENAPEESEE